MRKFLIKLSIAVAAFVAIGSACLMDSDPWEGLFVAWCVSMGWLALVGYANSDYRTRKVSA